MALYSDTPSRVLKNKNISHWGALKKVGPIAPPSNLLLKFYSPGCSVRASLMLILRYMK